MSSIASFVREVTALPTTAATSTAAWPPVAIARRINLGSVLLLIGFAFVFEVLDPLFNGEFAEAIAIVPFALLAALPWWLNRWQRTVWVRTASVLLALLPLAAFLAVQWTPAPNGSVALLWIYNAGYLTPGLGAVIAQLTLRARYAWPLTVLILVLTALPAVLLPHHPSLRGEEEVIGLITSTWGGQLLHTTEDFLLRPLLTIATLAGLGALARREIVRAPEGGHA